MDALLALSDPLYALAPPQRAVISRGGGLGVGTTNSYRFPSILVQIQVPRANEINDLAK